MSIPNKNIGDKNQNGFSAVEVLLLLSILGAVIFAGFYVVNRQSDDTADNSNQESSQQGQPDISDSQDLQSAEEDLDDINLEELDTTELDAAEADLL